MKVLITSNSHRLYGRVGTIEMTGRLENGDTIYVLRVGDDWTRVRDSEMKPIKRQDVD